MKIKGFDKDMKCRGMQFEVGEEYKIAMQEIEKYGVEVDDGKF